MTISRIPSVEGGIQPTLLTAKGDLISATAASTVARLAVGSDAQILVADSSTATGLKWAAAASGSAMTLISRTTFSGVASQTFDGVFTTTYENYVVYFNMLYAATAADDPQLSLRYEGTDISTAHYTSRTAITIGTTTQTITTQSGAAFVSLSSYTGSAAEPGGGYMHFANVGNTGNKGNGWSAYNDGGSGVCSWVQSTFASGAGVNKIATGFKIFSSSSNITGTVTIYGLAKS